MSLSPVVLMLPRDRGRTEERKPNTTQQNEEHNRTSRPDGAGVLPMLLANQEERNGSPSTQNTTGASHLHSRIE